MLQYDRILRWHPHTSSAFMHSTHSKVRSRLYWRCSTVRAQLHLTCMKRASKSSGRAPRCGCFAQRSVTSPIVARTRRYALRRVNSTSIEIQKCSADDWNVLSKGLTKTYRKGRRAFLEVQSSSTNRRLHAWRKQAKYTWHHVETLRVLAPTYIDRIARRFGRLLRKQVIFEAAQHPGTVAFGPSRGMLLKPLAAHGICQCHLGASFSHFRKRPPKTPPPEGGGQGTFQDVLG